MTAERSLVDGDPVTPSDPAPADGGSAADSDTPGSAAAQAGDGPVPSDAYQALGGETRVAVVRTLASDGPLAFSDLYAATDENTSAGFAYHLRQLTGRFVRQRDGERYELTAAGRAAARDLEAGSYTRRVDRDPVDLDEDCPLCEAPSLVATVSDSVTEVACTACGTTLLRLSVPPGGYDRDVGVAEAADAHHRRRIDAFADGHCPDCAGSVATSVEPAGEATTDGEADRLPTDARDAGDAADHTPVQAAFECETCGASLRCPVALTLRSHPAVVSFYHDHGEDVRDRPVWNVGAEWRERLVSTDPWCVTVSTRLDDECLFLYVARDGRVLDHRRQPAQDAAVGASDGRSGDDPDDDPDGDSRPVDPTETSATDPPTADDGDLDHTAATDGATA